MAESVPATQTEAILEAVQWREDAARAAAQYPLPGAILDRAMDVLEKHQGALAAALRTGKELPFLEISQTDRGCCLRSSGCLTSRSQGGELVSSVCRFKTTSYDWQIILFVRIFKRYCQIIILGKVVLSIDDVINSLFKT